ncbi:ubiquitin carboxyl-terminal hydrolase 8 isoform X1 [Anastrepha ludens]|uniref:ubiquitin carboxyl-terminal hydrolase 8 isoform X1 n=1 Tax=Anastrepha ludens TaxID=28586 RepID=UPI0023B1583D|nr:ubiquitin carboxyl-terminal hydrolase 8 isoform X1 [Anastrepha ludens]XP_053969325.1 ubiquitin carboxyl-terminal hydrolase 8 isoform X1 [Anastrepha ludens]XP_053969326.1 ubiquitin carboxyl-terminal hydrolase 8 isoform X1 [Anastrepha ludens]
MPKMAQVKDLHLGKTLNDLEKHSEIPEARTKKTQILVESARKLLREADKYFREGDEELAYVLYMKYFNLLHCIHLKPDYPEHKQTVRQILGGNSNNKLTMNKLEQLSSSLSRRYEAKQLANGAKQSATLVAPTLKYNERVRDYNELSASEKFDLLKGDTPSTAATNLSGSYYTLQPLGIIKCEEMFELMKKNNVLIMDCRPAKDYETSYLTYPYCFNVPEEHIVAGMSAGKLQDKLDSSSKILWSARSVKEQIVLMDWNTRDANPSPTSPIAILLDILRNWDPDVIYRSPIKILQGGYEFFIMMYPTLCTNPSVQAPQQNNNDLDLIDDIEYPSINDITMKEDISGQSYSSRPGSSMSRPLTFTVSQPPPSVDRTSKMAAMKTYEQKQKPIVELAKEQEELLEKAQANDEQLKKASQKLDTIFEKNKHSPDKKPMTATETELLYYIMQLESEAADYKTENDRLLDEIEKYKNFKKEQGDELTPNEKEDLENTARQIEHKIQERQKLNEQLEREKEQRDQQLAMTIARARVPIDRGDDMSKPKIPQFDRSVKPHLSTVTQSNVTTYIVDRQRDFSPLPGAMGRGLTGLKNLGNTCYMNSIIQCLSNTPQLTEYCITDKYKNYISRSNKTKGHIVEEVAALIKVLWNGNYKCVASKDLRYVMGQYQQIFRGIEQQDSHEFLTILMDWLHSDLQTLHVPEKTRDNITPSEKAWLEFTKAKESLILHLFYGQIKSTVKCVDCNKESATYECFSNLSLELPSNANVCFLTQCMDMYFSGELIHGWNCPNCKKKRDAVKKLDISKLPPVLVIHLKRFYADTDAVGNSYKKKQNYVRFPLENLDMTPYIAKSESRSATPKTYQLYGVSNHYGSMESGHYTAFCKSGNYGRWFKFDDQVVTPLDTSNVVSSAAYILFYTWLPPIQITDNNNTN